MNQPFDLEAAQQELGLDPELLKTALTMFRDDLVPKKAALTEARENGDGDTLRRIVHSLKGTAGTLGAHGIEEACLGWEEAWRSGTSDDGSAYRGLLEAIDRFKADLDNCLSSGLS